MPMLGARAVGWLLAAGVTVAGATVARAGDPLAEDMASVPAGHMFDVAFGATLTSDYLWRGITQTDHGAALQGYVEPSLGILYAGIWASNVAFGGSADTEVDLYAGIRPEFDMFSFDFGYNHAFYLNDPGSDSGEFFAKAYATVVDPLTLGGEFYVNPNGGATYIEANADLTLPHNLGLSGAIGAVGGDTPYSTWNAGIYYVIADFATLDLRYSDTNLSMGDCAGITGLTGNECDGRVLLSLSIDTSFATLKGE